MQVLIRRQGVSIRAEWDGLAKPSDKQLHYWLRVRPEAPVVNERTSSVVTDALVAPVAANLSSPTVETISYALAMNLRNVIENRATSLAQPRGDRRTALSTERLWQNRSVAPARPGRDPRLQFLSLDGYGPRNSRLVSVQQVAEGTAFHRNTLRVVVSSVEPLVAQSRTQARDGVAVLRAPLPSDNLIQSNELSYDAAPAPTDPTHMELVTQVNDALAHTHWSRTPKPTHFVQESQTPLEPETVRTTPPEIMFMGGLGNTLIAYGNGAKSFTNRGPWDTFRKRGSRGAISYPLTNGLTADNYDASDRDYNAPDAFSPMASDGVDPTGVGQWYYGAGWRVPFVGEPWVSVDLGRPVWVSGVGLYSSKSSSHARYIVVQLSYDGKSWFSQKYFYVTGDYQWQYVDFNDRFVQHVRFVCKDNWGTSDYIGIDRAEVYMR